MTPPRLTSRRDHADGLDVHINNDHDVDLDILFIDPMLGSSLQVYIDKDVSGWEDLAAALVVRRVNLSITLQVNAAHFNTEIRWFSLCWLQWSSIHTRYSFPFFPSNVMTSPFLHSRPFTSIWSESISTVCGKERENCFGRQVDP